MKILLNDILDNDEVNEIFHITSHILCNSCINCNTSNNALNINWLDGRDAVTGGSGSTVTTVADPVDIEQQQSLSFDAQQYDFRGEIRNALSRVNAAYPAPDCNQWIEKYREGHWYLMKKALKALDAACVARDVKKLTDAVECFEQIHQKAFDEYRQSHKITGDMEKGDTNRPTEKADGMKCYWCGSTDLWQGYDRKICRRCHPPAPGAEKRYSKTGGKQ